MKKLMISIFAIAAMVSCTSENEIIDNNGPDKGGERVEIKLNAGVNAVTKAPISSISTDLNIYFARLEDGEATTATELIWTGITSAQIIPAQISKESTNPITFYKDANRNIVNPQYYSVDPKKYSYLIGYFIDNLNPTITDGTISFTITGKEDIMATAAKVANKENQFGEMTFHHKLAQLTFKIGAQSGKETEVKNLYGNITKIEAIDQHADLTLTLGENSSIAAAPSSTANAKFSIENSAGQELTGNSTDFEGGIMIFADKTIGTNENPINLKVYSINFPDGIVVPVTLPASTTLESGTRQNIELTFTQSEIQPTAKIDAWKDAEAAGSGTVK